MKKIMAVLALVVAAMFMMASPSQAHATVHRSTSPNGVVNSVIPRHHMISANKLCDCLWTAHVQWQHNPTNWPLHGTEVITTYVDTTGATSRENKDMTLYCSPNDPTVWGQGTNINGTELDWGAQTSTTYNVHWAASGGGNVVGCGQSNYMETPGDAITNLSYGFKGKWHFTTNYQESPDGIHPGQPNDTVEMTFNMYRGSCTVGLDSGPGQVWCNDYKID